MMALYSVNHMEPINTMCRQNAEFRDVRAGGNGKKKKLSYPHNRPWRPIGFWDVKAPAFSRQSAHRWREVVSLMHRLATLYPQEDSWYSFQLEAVITTVLRMVKERKQAHEITILSVCVFPLNF
jgi:hypothetical protein